MIDKLRQELTEFLNQHRTGHLALTGLEGPWAPVVCFISADLSLYLIEPRASDLVFFIENDSHLVLTVDEAVIHLGELLVAKQPLGRCKDNSSPGGSSPERVKECVVKSITMYKDISYT